MEHRSRPARLPEEAGGRHPAEHVSTSRSASCSVTPCSPGRRAAGEGRSPGLHKPVAEATPSTGTGDREGKGGLQGSAAPPRSWEQKAWNSLRTYLLTSLHPASSGPSLPRSLFEETQRSRIRVQQTCPDKQAEPFPAASHTLHLAPVLCCLSLATRPSAPLPLLPP